MWKTALVALVAVGLASPCNVAGPAAYEVLLAHAGRANPVIDTDVGPVPLSSWTVEAALQQLGILRASRGAGPITRFLTWLGIRESVPAAPSTMTTAIIRLPDDRVVVGCIPTFQTIPGEAWVTLHVVDGAGRVTRTGPINTGYRCGFPQVSSWPSGRFGAGVVILPLMDMGGSPKLQHYFLRDDRFRLVRVEDPETGAIRKNHYGAPNFTLGPDLPDLDAAGWRARLASDDPVTLLETLVWLGGVHLDVHREPPDWYHEDEARARIWDEVVTDERTKARLRELAESGGEWVAEAARCAMEIERYP